MQQNYKEYTGILSFRIMLIFLPDLNKKKPNMRKMVKIQSQSKWPWLSHPSLST